MTSLLAPSLDPASFRQRAEGVAELLRAIANPHRLMVLCHLVEHGEVNVSDLVTAVGLSQSALSQHLARLRADGLVTFRRESQTLWYRIADPRTQALLATLHQLYCQD